MEAFLPAAGLGTRLKPITDSIPKALVKVNSITLLEIAINNLAKVGVNKIIVNVHHFSSQIIDFLASKNNFGLDIVISDETSLLLDTGGGLKKALSYISENQFLIHNVDILTGLDLKTFYQSHSSNNAISTLAVQRRNSSRYFLFDNSRNLCGWENIKTGEKRIVRKFEGELSRFAFSGIHAVNKDIISLMPRNDVFSVIDLYLEIAERHQITYFEHSETPFIDLGKIENLNDAEKYLNNLKG